MKPNDAMPVLKNRTMAQYENLLIARDVWLRTRPERVYPRLAAWFMSTGIRERQDGVFLFDAPDCGSTACFLGHMAMAPEFAAMGVTVERSTLTPKLTSNQRGFGVAKVLFGTDAIAMQRGKHVADAECSDANDWQCVMNRIDWELAHP
jgi:hypothetical protein